MKLKKSWSQYLAEFIGTFFLIFFGCGSMILAELGQPNIGVFVPIIFGGTVSIMIYAVGHISGAHFNPAVTIAFWAARNFPGYKIFGFVTAQIAGATCASAVHLIVWGGDHTFGSTLIQTSVGVSFLLEVIMSFALMFVIISVATDSRAKGELAGIAIGSTVALCSFVGGPLTMASINPARTLGPASLSGEFSHLWLYILAPIFGAIIGAKSYEFIRDN